MTFKERTLSTQLNIFKFLHKSFFCNYNIILSFVYSFLVEEATNLYVSGKGR